jgi:hypothetical protein
VEDLWRTWLGSRDVGGARWGFPVPDRSKTAVSDACRPALRRRKSRRALSQTVLTDDWRVGLLDGYFPFFAFWSLNFPFTHWKWYLWYSGFRTFLQYWPLRMQRSPQEKFA